MNTVIDPGRPPQQSLLSVLFVGGRLFYIWIGFLGVLFVAGVAGFAYQTNEGLVVSNMREHVSWGYYISNFTFLVGVAAAAVLLVIPAYLYHFKAIKNIVAFGELLAITAVVMSMLFLTVDTGRPERFWHAIPGIGSLNLPQSILGWDIIVLSGYLMITIISVSYVAGTAYLGRELNRRILVPLILISIPWAVVVHSVTAFIFNGLVARPFWNASILAPRFLASAFCAGPAMMIIIFQILRKVANFNIRNSALFKLAEIVSYAMAINIFLLCAEVYKEYYSDTELFTPLVYLFSGLRGHDNLVPWIWTATIFNVTSFLLLLFPATRKNLITLNIGCGLVFVGIWIEKGMGLIIPGFVPDSLGEIYEYTPSWIEFVVGIGIWAFGALFYTFMVRILIAIDNGSFRHHSAPSFVPDAEDGLVAADIMSKNVSAVFTDTPITTIRELLLEKRISGVPVIDEEKKVVGVVSETDIVISLLHKEAQLGEKLKEIIMPVRGRRSGKRIGETAAEVMSSPAITALANTPIHELTEIVVDQGIKRVIIVDSQNCLIGIVTQIDIVKAQYT